ncbi:Ankyrin repeat and KH domain-containing protein 1 [Cladobotryum mycophilum]|uniref:Ankyrin repeat and KH domain-containing protein 1 n=1 Tax=Cladobotryum mycophilum TaxID=491253 RepID=A0ABR0SBT0_9HYPO
MSKSSPPHSIIDIPKNGLFLYIADRIPTPLSLRPLDAAWDPSLATEDGDESCWTPLQLAARSGDADKVAQILTSSPSAVNDPPCGYYGQTALQAACLQGHEDVVKLLLSTSADIHFAGGNNFQRNALQIACDQGNQTIVEMLLEAGAKINTPLSDNSPAPHRSPPKLAKTTTVVTRYNGRTALQAAIERGHLQIATRLLDLGAEVNAPPSPTGGCTALQAAAHGGFTAMMQLLLHHGALVNQPAARYKGFTALQGACLTGNLEAVDILIKAGANIYAFGGLYGEGTALHAAAENGHGEIIKKLVEAGADINSYHIRRWQTPIQGAAAGGHTDVVQLLRSMGAAGKTGGGGFLFPRI